MSDLRSQKDHILVIKLSALGDFIQALGPMAAIRAHHPDARITLLTTRPYTDLGKACGYFDDVWIDSRPRWHQPGGWLDLRGKLNKAGFTRVYDLQNNDRTSLYFKLFALPRPEWVGTASGASHRNVRADRMSDHAFDRHVQTLALAGITDITLDDLSWIERDISHFRLSPPYILLVPGSAPQHPAKRWPVHSYGLLARSIYEKGYQPVVIGTAQEAPLGRVICENCSAAVDLTGRTDLFDIAVLARGAAAGVGNDTGPMHMIAPTGCPSLILFSGQSDPARHAAKGPSVKTLRHRNIEDIALQDVMAAMLI